MCRRSLPDLELQKLFAGLLSEDLLADVKASAMWSEIKGMANKAATRKDSDTTENIRKWIQNDEKKGLGQVHAWTKRTSLAPFALEAISDNNELLTHPLDVVVKPRQRWRKRWRR